MSALELDRRLRAMMEEAGTPGIVGGVVSAVVFVGQSAHHR
jgi:tetrahydromethanopterin S-methyltransferase subunit F